MKSEWRSRNWSVCFNGIHGALSLIVRIWWTCPILKKSREIGVTSSVVIRLISWWSQVGARVVS